MPLIFKKQGKNNDIDCLIEPKKVKLISVGIIQNKKLKQPTPGKVLVAQRPLPSARV
jgi:hypothetical protein